MQALTFDLDGTLVHTAGEIAAAVNLTLAQLALPPQTEAAITHHVGAGLHATLDGVLAQLGHATPPGAHTALDTHYARLAGSVAQPYPGAAEMLAGLREAGLRLACVTNKAHRFAVQVLRGTGLAPLLDDVVGGDTLPWKKPDARVLRQVCAALGVAPAQTAHVGDSATDVQAARAAGLAAWVVPWGYRGGQTVADLGADRVFDSFAALTRAVRQTA